MNLLQETLHFGQLVPTGGSRSASVDWPLYSCSQPQDQDHGELLCVQTQMREVEFITVNFKSLLSFFDIYLLFIRQVVCGM